MTIKNKFAHLMGLGVPAAEKKAEGDTDERKQREGESDDDYQKRMKELDDDGSDDKDGKKAKGKKAGAKKAESDDDTDDERKQRDDESDEDYEKRMKEIDDNEDDKAKAAAFKERARCVSILSAFQAQVNDPTVKARAEQTRVIMCSELPTDQAVTAIKAGGAIAAAAKPAPEPNAVLDKRMAGAGAAAAANNLKPDGNIAKPDMNTSAGVAAAILASGNGSQTIKPNK